MNDSIRKQRLLTLAVLVVYAAIQGLAVTASWFPADDDQELAFLRTMGSGVGLFGVDAFGLFRPVKNLLFFLFAHLEPFGMPAVRSAALAIGIATFFPVLAFFRRIWSDGYRALFAAAVWLLAPTLVSSVVWLSCVNIQLMCGLAAAAFVFHDRERPFAASILLFLACISYESAVAIGPCIVVFDFFLRTERLKTRRGRWTYALYAAVTVAFLLLRHLAGSAHSVNGSFAGCTRADLMVASAYFACQHFLSWFWPFGRMTVFGGYAAGSVSATVLALAWVILTAAAATAILLRRNKPAIGFGIAFALVAFLPVSNITGVGNGPYGDYYLGLPSFGLAAALVAAAGIRIFRILVPAVRLAALAAAFHWAWLWADGDRAYFAAAENFPAFFGNKLFLVTRLWDAGLRNEALQLARDVEMLIGPDSGQMAGIHLVRSLYESEVRQDAGKALDLLEKSRRVDDFGGPLRNRDYYKGCVYEDRLGNLQEAERLYASALRGKWTFGSVQPADRLARLKAERGLLDEAIALWSRALVIDPDNAAVRHNLNTALEQRKKADVHVP